MITISGVTRRDGVPPFLENLKNFPNGSPLCFSPKFFKNHNGLPLWFFTKNDQNFLFFHQKGPKFSIFFYKNYNFLSTFSLKTSIFQKNWHFLNQNFFIFSAFSTYKQAFFNKKIRLRRWLLHWLKDFNKIFVENRSVSRLKMSVCQKKCSRLSAWKTGLYWFWKFF